MKHEIYAHKDIGVIDITELLRAFPKDSGLVRLKVAEFLFHGEGEHDFDQAHLQKLRQCQKGLFYPLLVVYEMLAKDPSGHKEKAVKIDIIDGWHRLQILHEIGQATFTAFAFPLETVKKFLVSPDIFVGGEEVKQFLEQ